MGCSQSMIENEEIISRCKERKQFMKEAVGARNGFAAAHSSYVLSLKNTGAALIDYAHAGVVQEHHLGSTQSVPVPTPSAFSYDDLRPPPPLPDYTSLQRASSMPELKISKPGINPVGSSTIIEEGDEDDEIDNEESDGGLRRRRRSSNRGNRSSSVAGKNEVLEQEEENPPPGTPPPSRTLPPQTELHHMEGPLKDPYEYIFLADNMPGPTLSDAGDVDINKEEIERKMFDKMPERVEEEDDVEEKIKTTSRKAEVAEPIEMVLEPSPPSMAVQAVGKSSKKPKQVGFVGSVEGKRAAKGHVDLVQIFVEIDGHFLKASQCATEVSQMLEATRLHYHSNFADNRGHINHSDRVMRVITWNRSFKGMPNVNNGKDDFDAEEQETHGTVLDKLLAWEKKLYDEVKAGEIMKFEYERKVATLEKLKNRSSNSESLEKVEAAVSHLHTRYIVDMQSLDSTVSEINRLRDKQLYPKLVQLVDGMSTMWDSMRIHHESQLKIASALKLLDLSQSPKETSKHHHERTIQLWAIVQEWHSQFEKLVSRQKDYVKALSSWLKLNLIPIDSSLKEKVSSPSRISNPPIKALLVAWHDFLENLPDEPLRTSIFTFAAVINTIMHHEEDEIKMKMKCEETSKELARKTRQFVDWHNKYVHRRIPDELDPERAGEENGQRDAVAEKQSVVESVKKRLEVEEETYQNQCLHVREKSLASLKNQLPELFRALSVFAAESAKMYRHLRSISQSQNPRASAA